ncbi:MAG: hypothetical protein JW908_02990 [Anaerolineales bacterium]|nr:hypothetical protein [Anaerolineales bacterium]
MFFSTGNFLCITFIPFIMAFCLGFARVTIFSNLKHATHKFIIVPMLSLMVGAVLGSWGINLFYRGCFFRWQSLPDLPEKANKILGISHSGDIWIETISKQIYHLKDNKGGNNPYWELFTQSISELESKLNYRSCQPRCVYMLDVNDSEAICISSLNNDAIGEYTFVLQDDDKVFRRKNISYFGDKGFIFAILGPLYGITILGIPVIFIMSLWGFIDLFSTRVKFKTKSRSENEDEMPG